MHQLYSDERENDNDTVFCDCSTILLRNSFHQVADGLMQMSWNVQWGRRWKRIGTVMTSRKSASWLVKDCKDWKILKKCWICRGALSSDAFNFLSVPLLIKSNSLEDLRMVRLKPEPSITLSIDGEMCNICACSSYLIAMLTRFGISIYWPKKYFVFF